MESPSQRLRVCNPCRDIQSLLTKEGVQLRTSNLVGTFIGSIRTKAHSKFEEKGMWARRIQGLPNFWGSPYYIRMGKATNFKFCTHRPIYRVHLNKSPLEILNNRAWAYPGTAQIFWIPLRPIILATGKATKFKFGQYIQMVHPNKIQLKILEKR